MGSDKQIFSIHKWLLCDLCPYFKTALEGSFKEGVEQRIEFMEENPAIFKDFQYWLYDRSISIKEDLT